MNFNLLKLHIGEKLESFLDIGAHHGSFSQQLLQHYPGADYFMVEATEDCRPFLDRISQKSYTIEVLSDKVKEVVFYTTTFNATNTGNSYYLEQTHFYSPDKRVGTIRTTNTLDNLFSNNTYDLIKVDTQGSEVDILLGGKHLVERSKFILLEVAVKRYNEGAPMADEVDMFMRSIGFGCYEKITDLYFRGEKYQEDRLYFKCE
jgi:FkbM family methyltransferase